MNTAKDMYRYYLTKRPPEPGAIPGGAANVHSYGMNGTEFDSIRGRVWGFAEYEKELDPAQVDAYEKDAKIGNEPYYPVVTEESTAIYQKYVDESKKYGNIFLCGRLAEFRYIDMHTCIEHALVYYENVKDYLTKNHG